MKWLFAIHTIKYNADNEAGNSSVPVRSGRIQEAVLLHWFAHYHNRSTTSKIKAAKSRNWITYTPELYVLSIKYISSLCETQEFMDYNLIKVKFFIKFWSSNQYKIVGNHILHIITPELKYFFRLPIHYIMITFYRMKQIVSKYSNIKNSWKYYLIK